MFRIGEKVKLIDTKTQKLLVNDFIVDEKMMFAGESIGQGMISFDRKFYFPLEKFSVELDSSELVVKLDQDYISDNYNVELWRNFGINKSADVYREFTIDELDLEVESLVNSLNNIEGIETLGSCCGHGREALFVTLSFSNLQSLNELLCAITSKFSDTFCLTTSKNLLNIDRSGFPKMMLKTIDGIVGAEAYSAAQSLADYLRKIARKKYDS